MQNDDVPSTTRVIFKETARDLLLEGLNIAADAVGCTLGPRGKTVLIQRKGHVPLVTKDGVTVSKSIRLKDPAQRMGADLIREAASQTNETAGDGTTTATILTQALVNEGVKLLKAGYPAKDLCDGIITGFDCIDESLVSDALKLNSHEEIAQVGTISANGDANIGTLIANAMERVGQDGIITVEDAKGTTTSMELVEGMRFERGYLSPYFVTNQDRMNVAYEDVRVLITDRKLAILKDLIPILEQVMQARQSLLIIAEDIEGEALHGLVINRVNANLPVVAVKAPGYGLHRDELLGDMAVLTGTKVASPSTGIKIDGMKLADLGTLKRVVVDAKTTTLVGTGATKEAIASHVASLRTQLEDITLSADAVVKLKMRIARLASGVAVIRVGGATEVEMIERKYRIEDALNATRAAVEEGIVPGGGMALVNAVNDASSELEKIHNVGVTAILHACLEPLRRIVMNAGLSPDVVLNELNRRKDGCGFNAATNEYVDLLAAGVIDPLKVTRTALKNAVSVATTFLTLDALIIAGEDE